MTNGSTETTFMGIDTNKPLFISPAAMAKLGHPHGTHGQEGVRRVIQSKAPMGSPKLKVEMFPIAN